ncbi:hypothetical protein HG535_0A07380 [Zygotorulaspora mrakii]|uniref:Putative lipase ATG15 n=1 Tax=Zygotorulaspora mrakii TaxID=42260 RepID=A0A7H9AWW5_ZYGMR|nr:uncharacterized protein HG535_0A07380 [Zygotorulaspora mrakii]QLG70796.1 hypothetical protein HG535_0A07380 [Zygotorulaspora mrakii]
MKQANVSVARRISSRRMYTWDRLILGVIAALLIFAYLSTSHNGNVTKIEADHTHIDDSKVSSFKLKHIHRHGVGKKHSYHQKLDITDEFLTKAKDTYENEVKIDQTDKNNDLWTTNAEYATDNPFDYDFKLKNIRMPMKRMADRSVDFIEPFLEFASGSPSIASKVSIDWVDDDVIAPNVTDKETVISLALMSSNAYVKLPYHDDWRNISSPWNGSESDGFGWDDDGLRGHIFVNKEEDIVVISFKGTSAQGLPGSGIDETTANDKINDNLLFSCCCARVSYLWTTVCDCYTKSYTCDESCLERELRKKDYYYWATLDIYKQVEKEYPKAAIWTAGHSLGGALATLLGRTYGLPAVAFEAPGDLLAARRLHLPFPPGLPSYQEGIWHIGHNADPIFMGTCNGASSSCSIAGYAMETSCHTGKTCVYDAVNDKGWHVNMLNHRIHTVIDGILTEYDEVAKCLKPEPCIDCYNWNYIRDKSDTISSTATKSSTKTKKMHQTSTSKVHSSGTTTSAASSCVGRNWFGICTEYEL